MNYTDKNIPIVCGECSEVTDGVQNMFGHILEVHPQYNQHEADVFALNWAEAAYDRADLEEEAYAKDQAYERSLNQLRGKP